MQCDLPQRFPIYDVSGMKDGSSDHNARLSKASGLCASLSVRAGRHRRFCDRRLGGSSQCLPNALIQCCGNFWAVAGTEISNKCKSSPPLEKKKGTDPLGIFKNTVLRYFIIFRSFDHGFFLSFFCWSNAVKFSTAEPSCNTLQSVT